MAMAYRAPGFFDRRLNMAASLLASIELTLHQFGQTLQACHARVRMRRRLSQLDERALHQFGLSRAEVLKELKKPFWVA